MTAGTTNRTVYPSAGAFAAASCPTLPPAPPRFSTMFGWPVCSASLEDTIRVTTSAGPPGGKGTIQRIGFDGQDSAYATCASSAAQKKIPAFIAAIVAGRRGAYCGGGGGGGPRGGGGGGGGVELGRGGGGGGT